MAKILLVEDDNNLREIYEARLQAEGYEIVAAQDGEEALAVAKKEQPDLVISDVMMPRISGFEMLDILRNTEGLKNVKVIMLTALGQAEDKTRADKLGADRYLVKSQVTLEDIVKAASDLLAGDEVKAAQPATAAPIDSAVPAQTVPAEPVAAMPVATPPLAMPVAEPPQPIAVAPQPMDQTATAPPPTPQSPVEPAAPRPVAPAPAAPPAEPQVPAADSTSATTPPAGPNAPTPAPAEPVNSGQVVSNAVQDLVSGTTPAPAQDMPAAPPATAATASIIPPAPTEPSVTSTPIPAPAQNTPAPAAPPTPDPAADSATVAGKKIIQPLSPGSVATPPDLNTLLAKEGITGMDQGENAAAANMPHPPGHVISPNPAGGNPASRPVDPNTIAL